MAFGLLGAGLGDFSKGGCSADQPKVEFSSCHHCDHSALRQYKRVVFMHLAISLLDDQIFLGGYYNPGNYANLINLIPGMQPLSLVLLSLRLPVEDPSPH